MSQVFRAYQQNAHDPNWCYNNFLNERALKQALNVRSQLERIMLKCELPLNSTPFTSPEYFTNIRKAICMGFFSKVAHKQRNGTYCTLKDNQPVVLHPSTCLQTKPDWVVFDEFVLTSVCFSFLPPPFLTLSAQLHSHGDCGETGMVDLSRPGILRSRRVPEGRDFGAVEAYKEADGGRFETGVWQVSEARRRGET